MSTVDDQLMPMIEAPGAKVVGLSTGETIFGRVTVTLSHRDAEVLAAIEEINDPYGEGQAVCGSATSS